LAARHSLSPPAANAAQSITSGADFVRGGHRIERELIPALGSIGIPRRDIVLGEDLEDGRLSCSIRALKDQLRDPAKKVGVIATLDSTNWPHADHQAVFYAAAAVAQEEGLVHIARTGMGQGNMPPVTGSPQDIIDWMQYHRSQFRPEDPGFVEQFTGYAGSIGQEHYYVTAYEGM
jgi:LmbE family N-acetylglucosaminyl deacetylase